MNDASPREYGELSVNQYSIRLCDQIKLDTQLNLGYPVPGITQRYAVYRPHHVLLADSMTLGRGKEWLSVRESAKIPLHELHVRIAVGFLLRPHIKSAPNTHPSLIRFAPVGLVVMLSNGKLTLIIITRHPGTKVSCLGLTILSKSSLDQMHTINLPMSSPPTP